MKDKMVFVFVRNKTKRNLVIREVLRGNRCSEVAITLRPDEDAGTLIAQGAILRAYWKGQALEDVAFFHRATWEIGKSVTPL